MEYIVGILLGWMKRSLCRFKDVRQHDRSGIIVFGMPFDFLVIYSMYNKKM